MNLYGIFGNSKSMSDEEAFPKNMSERDKSALFTNIKLRIAALFLAAAFFLGTTIYLFVESGTWKVFVAGGVIVLYVVFLALQYIDTLKNKKFIIVEGVCTNVLSAGILNRDSRYSFYVLDKESMSGENLNTFELNAPKRSNYSKNVAYYFCFKTDKYGMTDYTRMSLLTSVKKTPDINRGTESSINDTENA